MPTAAASFVGACRANMGSTRAMRFSTRAAFAGGGRPLCDTLGGGGRGARLPEAAPNVREPRGGGFGTPYRFCPRAGPRGMGLGA